MFCKISLTIVTPKSGYFKVEKIGESTSFSKSFKDYFINPRTFSKIIDQKTEKDEGGFPSKIGPI